MVLRKVPLESKPWRHTQKLSTKGSLALGDTDKMSNGYDKLVPVGPNTFKRRNAARGYDSRDKRCTNCNRRLIASKSQRDRICAICIGKETNFKHEDRMITWTFKLGNGKGKVR